MKQPKIVAAFGTRPEQLKLAPVIAALRAEGAEVVEWCSGQSKDLMEGNPFIGPWQSISHGLAGILDTAGNTFVGADAILVQGDTATAFGCALAAWLAEVPVAHVEAGLRTYAAEPWPEEGFRRMIAAMARWHFCPDQYAYENISRECGAQHVLESVEGEKYGRWYGTQVPNGLLERIHITGNPIIDTLGKQPFRVLVTLHRRENWGLRIRNALRELHYFARATAAEVTVIEHPNWRSWWYSEGDEAWYRQYHRLNFISPMPHTEMLAHMREASVVVTDSGGLQEEAAHFGVPCIVVRSATERTALLWTGAVELVDPDNPAKLRQKLEAILIRRRCYGNGDAGRKIAEILLRELRKLKEEAA